MFIITLVGTFAAWFMTQVCRDLFQYYSLRQRVNVQIVEIDIREVKNNKFYIIAKYSYAFREKKYLGEGNLGDTYLNIWAAREAQKKLTVLQGLNGWLDPNHPEKSSIVKNFPLKKTISATILLGLTIYFLILGYIVKVKYG
jgi:hypothetical protein